MVNKANTNLKYITFSQDGDVIEVKNGFSWTAFFFGFWVYLARKMWISSGIWFFVFVICLFAGLAGQGIAANGGTSTVAGMVSLIRLGYSIYQGATINNKYMDMLIKQGYTENIGTPQIQNNKIIN